MWTAIRSSWPLFVGMLFLMVSNGLLATLLSLRAGGLGFSDSAIGIMQSFYPIGSLLGCIIVPRFIASVGHVRIFAALASIASAAALVHLVTDDLWSWSAMRWLSGFCFSGLYVVSESWLNAGAKNDTRGTLLSVYFIVQTGGVTIGQLLLNLSSPDGILLFIVVSILISFALVPMLISNTTSPPYEVPERITFTALLRLSPMGLSGSFLNGISQVTLYVMLALYGRGIELSNSEIGGLLGCMTLGGMLFQYPIGKLSDQLDRRLVIVGAPGLSIPLCIFLMLLDNPSENLYLLYAMIALLGGLTLPIYSVCMAHLNDYLKPSQVVAASGTLVLVLAVGMIIGPILGGVMIDNFGPNGMFYLLSITAALTVMTALFRLWHGASYDDGNRVAIVPVSANFSPEATSLYPSSGNHKEQD